MTRRQCSRDGRGGGDDAHVGEVDEFPQSVIDKVVFASILSFVREYHCP